MNLSVSVCDNLSPLVAFALLLKNKNKNKTRADNKMAARGRK
jgi:hypothetical protein